MSDAPAPPDLSALGDLPDGSDAPPSQRAPQHTVVIPDDVSMVSLLGPRDELLRTMERAFPHAEIHVRGNEFRISGASADVALIERLIDELLVVIDSGLPLNRDAVERSIGMLRTQSAQRPADVLTMNIVSNRGRTIRPKTLGQKEYVDAIDDNTIVFGIGPAGTGKTYLAMAKAVVRAIQLSKVMKVFDPQARPLTTAEAFYMATKGGGSFFGKVGSFEEGYAFDALVVEDDPRIAGRLSLEERLQRFLYTGDDRNIVARFAAGRQVG